MPKQPRHYRKIGSPITGDTRPLVAPVTLPSVSIGKKIAPMDKFPKFELYSYVHKKTGYKYPGMVVSVFTTRGNELRYVVEAIHPDYEGMLHIFSEEQLVNTNKELLRIILTAEEEEGE